ncbi:MAG: TIGR02757 family protein [Bacteroidaceae bacterium]|nr:TIGR02757 family protein [Bacteroidaceae bacterium]
MEKETLEQMLIRYSAQYESTEFLVGDPSWFMHQVDGAENQEAMAFIASVLSYGNRSQFMARVQQILENTDGRVDTWVRNGSYERMFQAGDKSCFYRLYSCDTMNRFLTAYRILLQANGTLGAYLRERNTADCLEAISAICSFFAGHGISVVIPKDTQSACKRVCMFMRWMVRSDSPVDLGLWADFIDRRTLIMPLDTHVLSQSVRLGLLKSRTASMSSAICLTKALAEIFPDDPLRGDFALFGYGVNHKTTD